MTKTRGSKKQKLMGQFQWSNQMKELLNEESTVTLNYEHGFKHPMF